MDDNDTMEELKKRSSNGMARMALCCVILQDPSSSTNNGELDGDRQVQRLQR